MLHAVVMAGGSGTRFWPASRRDLPKQFGRVVGDRTLIQQTVARTVPWIPLERTWVVTGAAHATTARRQLPELSGARLLVEPCGRNTAPCIGLAAICVLADDPEATMLVMPADHVIRPAEAFRDAAGRAAGLVAANPERLVLFGVRPTYPATGFGYIERGLALAEGGQAWGVEAFREKPDPETAERYVASESHYWNCGIFVWRAATILQRLAEHAPQIFERLEALRPAVGTKNWPDVLAAQFPAMPSISIDYSVLERADAVCVLEAPFDWDDVGSWEALLRLEKPDSEGNVVVGLHCGVKTSGCVIRGGDDHLLATIGLSDCIIVHTPDATLVAKRGDENALRQLVAAINERGYERFL